MKLNNILLVAVCIVGHVGYARASWFGDVWKYLFEAPTPDCIDQGGEPWHPPYIWEQQWGSPKGGGGLRGTPAPQ